MRLLVHVNDSATIAARLGAAVSSRVQRSKPGVALILVDTGKSTLKTAGTGFAIRPDLIMTAGHVLDHIRQVLKKELGEEHENDLARIRVHFNVAYTAATAGKSKHPNPDQDLETHRPKYQCAAIVEELYDPFNGVDDYAILRINRPSDPPPSDHVLLLPIEETSIQDLPIAEVPGQQPTSSITYTASFTGELLSLQHPNGEPMQATTGPVLYFNQQKDTAQLPGPHHFLDMLCYAGSSGSPIIDSADKVVAVLLGPSTKRVGKGGVQACRVMPMDRIYRQSPTLRNMLAPTF